MKNKNKTWYLVINNGSIVAKSDDKLIAEQYADEMNAFDNEESAHEYGGYYEIERVRITSNLDEDTEIDAGSYSFTVNEIRSVGELDEQYFF